MKNNKLTKGHYLLFVASFLAVVISATPYVRAYVAERRATSQPETGAMGRGGPGGSGGFNPQRMAARRLEQMTGQLQLTAEQTAKIKAIQESFAPRTQAIIADASLSREQRREKMQPLRTEMNAQIRQVLTAEQQTKYDQMQSERRARFGGGNDRNNRDNRNGNGGAVAPVNPPAPPSTQP